MRLADARCICLFRIVAHQRHQVGFIDEVQKIDVLGIAAAVDHDIKGVAALALHRDKLLVLQAILHADGGGRLQNIVNSGQIAVRRQRWDADALLFAGRLTFSVDTVMLSIASGGVLLPFSFEA